MRWRVCGREIGNGFQLVCDFCTRREEEYDRKCQDLANEIINKEGE